METAIADVRRLTAEIRQTQVDSLLPGKLFRLEGELLLFVGPVC